MSSSLSTATPVRHIKASFLHGRDGGKAGQVAVAAAAIANSIAQQQQQSQPPHQPKRPSIGEGTTTTSTSTSTKSTSHRNGLAGSFSRSITGAPLFMHVTRESESEGEPLSKCLVIATGHSVIAVLVCWHSPCCRTVVVQLQLQATVVIASPSVV